jgi:hypothetical protein
MMKKLILMVVCGLTLLLIGCLSSEKPVLFPGSGKSPDLSGEYEFEEKKKRLTIYRSDKGKNSFYITDPGNANKQLFFIIEKLNNDYWLFQLYNQNYKKSKYVLCVAQIQKGGIIFPNTPPFAHEFAPIFSRYKLTVLDGVNGEKSWFNQLQGDMPQEEYSKAVKAALLDLITEKVIPYDEKNIFLKKK